MRWRRIREAALAVLLVAVCSSAYGFSRMRMARSSLQALGGGGTGTQSTLTLTGGPDTLTFTNSDAEIVVPDGDATALSVVDSNNDELMRFDSTSNRVGIGSGAPGYTLDVNGVVNAVTSYRLEAGGETIGGGGSGNWMTFDKDTGPGYLFGGIFNPTGAPGEYAYRFEQFTVSAFAGNAGGFMDVSTNALGGCVATSDKRFLRLGDGFTFAPTTGSADYYGLELLSTINMTGTANGHYEGIRVDITETSLGAGSATAHRLLSLNTDSGEMLAVGNDGATTIAAGIGALTFSHTDAELLVPDADATAFEIVDSGADQLMRFDSANNRVGIGTGAPAATLDVAGNATFDSLVTGSAGFRASNGSYVAGGGATTTLEGGNSGAATEASLSLVSGVTTNLRFALDGGALTADNPPQASTIEGTRAYDSGGAGTQPGGDVRIYGGTGSTGDTTEGDVILAWDGTDARGFVGIGTGAPAQLLDVAGVAEAGTFQTGIAGPLTITQRTISTSATDQVLRVEGNGAASAASLELFGQTHASKPAALELLGGTPGTDAATDPALLFGVNAYDSGGAGTQPGGPVRIAGGTGSTGDTTEGDVELGYDGTDARGHVVAWGARVDEPESLTCTDSGDGNPGTLTITPTHSYIDLTVADADGCTVTMGETGIADGQSFVVINVSANTANFADTPGVTELAGAFAAGQWDSLSLRYASDRWVETSRSNN